MERIKINLGGKAQVKHQYDGRLWREESVHTSGPTSIDDYKQLIRDAHGRKQLEHLKIKDYGVVQDYLAARAIRRKSREGNPTPTLDQRLRSRLVQLPPTDHTSRCHLRHGHVADYDPRARMWVIQDHGYLETGGKTWYYHASWLCGMDDGHYFTHRVPERVSTIAEAVAWLKPAVVLHAEQAGKRVMRQGDVWFVESRFRTDDTRALPWSHRWDAKKRDCIHAEHGTLHIPYNFRAYINKGIAGGAVD